MGDEVAIKRSWVTGNTICLELDTGYTERISIDDLVNEKEFIEWGENEKRMMR